MRRPPGEELLTVEQFRWIPDFKPHLEFVGGRVVQKRGVDLARSLVHMELVGRVGDLDQARRLGQWLAYCRCSFGGMSLVPELCFITRERLPRGPDGRLADDVEIAPDLLFETGSSEYPPGELASKLGGAI